MSLNVTVLKNQDKMILTMNFGAHMMMGDMGLKMAVFSDKKLHTQEESKTQNASTVTNMKL